LMQRNARTDQERHHQGAAHRTLRIRGPGDAPSPETCTSRAPGLLPGAVSDLLHDEDGAARRPVHGPEW
jgi:hypothetical protein